MLAPLLREAAFSAPALPPRVTDLGDRFEVAVAGQGGLYTDINRDCVERARIAAVFIALVLTTPTIHLVAPQAVLPSTLAAVTIDASARPLDGRVDRGAL